jgi:hypothetical protein
MRPGEDDVHAASISLDKIEAFGPDTKSAEHKQFTAERLAAGATMLRDIWWTAYVTSGPDIGKP